MQQQESKLDELKQFHKEYLARFQDAAQSGISATQLQEYRAFLGKLERAIQAQEKIVSTTLSECSECKQKWQHKHMRTQVMGKVIARYQDSEHKQAESREQKETDDHNQRVR
jgi:flagellar FliJ protein